MTAKPTPLPGMPEPPTPDDYETWEALVRPVFEQAAATGRPFLCWVVADDHHLPHPPNQRLDWARLVKGLRTDGLIYWDGYGAARDGSAVKQWRGTRAARQEAAA
jgi:hypothetical protein